jgi:ribonuclease P protein component
MHSFSRLERLKSRTTIGKLFTEGHSFMAYPVRVVWLELPANTPAPAQLAVSVPKRVFKTAVARNRIKRLIREAYRLQKTAFYDKLAAENRQPVALMLVYVAKETLTFREVQAGVSKMIRKFPG